MCQSPPRWLVARVYETGSFIYGGVFTYTPGTPPYEPLDPPVRDPRMWGVERDPRASLGRRGAHGDGLVGVFGAVSVAAVESLRGTVARWRHGNPHT